MAIIRIEVSRMKAMNVRMIRIALLVLAAIAAGNLGCTGSGKNASNTPPEGQRQGLHPTNDFEARTGDPPFTADTHFAAGQLAEGQNDLPHAVAQYLDALKIDPNHQPSLYRLAAVYTRLRQFPDAERIWQRYIQATGGAPAGYNNLGFCFEMAGNIDQAEKAYQAGVARDPKNAGCRVNYGLMLARQGRIEDAVVQLQAVLAPAEVAYNLGSVCEQQGQKDRAKGYYQKALELDPTLHDAKARLEEMH
jgi:tetratricopeptide (TPR) repeat protein